MEVRFTSRQDFYRERLRFGHIFSLFLSVDASFKLKRGDLNDTPEDILLGSTVGAESTLDHIDAQAGRARIDQIQCQY
jgi:hypothetical protein